MHGYVSLRHVAAPDIIHECMHVCMCTATMMSVCSGCVHGYVSLRYVADILANMYVCMYMCMCMRMCISVAIQCMK